MSKKAELKRWTEDAKLHSSIFSFFSPLLFVLNAISFAEALSKLFQFSTPGAFMPSPLTKPGCATLSCAVLCAQGLSEDVVSGHSVTWSGEIRKLSWTHLQSLKQDSGGCHWKWMLHFPAARARPVWQQRYLNISVQLFWKNPREMKWSEWSVRSYLFCFKLAIKI